MCVEVSRGPARDTTIDAEAAGSFAAEAVNSVLGSTHRHISHDAKILMAEMVRRLGAEATEATVLVHRDHVELLAAGHGRLEQDVVSAPGSFATDVACSL